MNAVFSQIRIYQILVVTLVVLLFIQWNCKGSSCPEYVDVVKTDTTYKKRSDSSGWTNPQPVKIRKSIGSSARAVAFNTFDESGIDTVFLPIPVDTAAIISAHYEFKDYDTTYKFKEAEVRVQNTVTQNRIESQRVLATFKIPEITKTVTKVEKKRGQIYVGVDAFGGTNTPLYGTGASIMYKTKRDRIYEVGPVVFKDQPVMIRAGVKFLISFRK